MKPKNSRFLRTINFRNNPCPRIAVTGLACLAVAAIQLSSSAFAADITWADAAGETTWTTDSTFNSAPLSTSWVGGTAPANSTVTDNAIFTTVANAQPNLTVQTRIRGVDFQMADGGLSMTGGNNLFQPGVDGISSSGQTSGTNTITNTRIFLVSSYTWNLFSTADSASTSTFTFDSNIRTNGTTLTIVGQRDSAAGNVGIINFDRSIQEGGGITVRSLSTNNTVNFNAANTYTGLTTVTAGIVNVSGDQSVATGGWSIVTPNVSPDPNPPIATVNFLAGSTVAVDSANKIQIGRNQNSGSFAASTLNVDGTVNNDGTLQMERASNLNLNSGAVWNQAGDMVITARGGNNAPVNVNAGAEMTYSGVNTVKLNAATNSGGEASLSVDGTGLFMTAAGFENTTTTTISGYGRVSLTNGGTVQLSADVTDFTTQTQFELGTGGGVIDNGGFNTTLSGDVATGYGPVTTGIFGTGSLTSQGSGTLTLSGANTYTGDTAISDGTLVVSETGSLFFAPTANGVSNKVTGAGLLSVDGAFNLDLSSADVANGNTWTLVDSASPVYDPDSFTVTSNLGAFTESPSGVHTLTNGGNTWTFTESTGQLTLGVSALSGYASWIGGFAVGGEDQPGDDPDNDGMDNLLEFVLNGNPSLSDNSILPKLNVTATDFEFTYQRRDDSVSPETTQTFQWGTTLATWPGSAVIPATSGTVGVATITVSPGIPDDAVTDTVKVSIPKTEAGASGKLFGRQQVVKP